MNSAIELHDSTVAEIAVRDGTVVVRFQPAYHHKSDGRPGHDVGTGWVQDACLSFADASVSGGIPDLPCPVWRGELVVGGRRNDGLVPLPLDVAGLAELRLVFDTVHTVTVKGRGARLELVGDPKYVEQFEPSPLSALPPPQDEVRSLLSKIAV